MMTLNEAIKHAEEVAEEKENEAQDLEYSKLDWKYEANQCSECAKEHRQLAEWLKELKQLKEQTRWIPCNERLPKKSGIYWCTFGRTNYTGKDYYTTESDAKEIFDEPEEYSGWQSKNVIAWMPLPESYKEESEE